MSNNGAIVQGPMNLADGTSSSERQSRSGEMLTSNVHAKYYDQAFRGKLFHCDFGVTATGIIISPIGTSSGIALANPSGVATNVSIISVRLGMVSSTLILGAIMHGLNTNVTAAAVTGTAGVVVAGLAGGGAVPNAKPFYTATLPATQTAARVFAYKQPTIATGNSYVLEDLLDGQISLAPGATWSLFTVGNDTSPLWKVSVTWEEIPI